MKIYTTIQKGHQHRHFCEDAVLSVPLGDELLVAAVSDGCSSGTDSHLASALTCKLIRKIACSLPVERSTASSDSLLPDKIAFDILERFFEELKHLKNQLMLCTDELLATLILLVYCKNPGRAFIVVLGDGAVAIDGEVHEINQDNRPNYPAYHLDNGYDFGRMVSWSSIVNQPQQLAISTDGIFSFQKTTARDSEISATDFLLTDRAMAENAGMLTRKCNILNKVHGLQPADDVGIVRVIFK